MAWFLLIAISDLSNSRATDSIVAETSQMQAGCRRALRMGLAVRGDRCRVAEKRIEFKKTPAAVEGRTRQAVFADLESRAGSRAAVEQLQSP
jgi:hypothetical protein